LRPSGYFNVNYNQDMAIVRTHLQWALLLGFLAFLAVIPLFLSNSLLHIINLMGITLILVLGLNLLTGYAGQISLGQAAFMAVGAYVSALLGGKAGLPFLLALPMSGAVAGLLGLILGLPSLRLKGFYLALATLSANVIILWVLAHSEALGGTAGLNLPQASIGPVTFYSRLSWYYLILPVTVIMVFLAKNIARSKAGRAFVAIRDNDVAASIMGISLYRYKLMAFLIACFFAGVSGSLFGYYYGRLTPEMFTVFDSVWFVGMIIVGGMGSTMGSVFGVVFLRGLEQALTVLAPALGGLVKAAGSATFVSGMELILFGVVIVVFLVFEPRGLAHRWELTKASYRLWPFGY